MMELPSELRRYPTWIKGRMKPFKNFAFQTLQGSKLKMFVKREENRVSTSHVLSMRPYAHIQAKHAKKGILVKHAIFPFRNLMQSQASHINQPNMLTNSTSNTYSNILETMFFYNPIIKE